MLSNGFSVNQLSTGNQESYQEVVLSVSGAVVGAIVVVVVVVVVVVAGVVLYLARNRCWRSLRRRRIRSRLRRSALCMLAWLSVGVGAAMLAAVVRTAFALVTIRMGLLPLIAMICLMRSQLDLAKVKLHGVAPES